MAVETRTIGTTGRNYSTITSWEAAIDNTTYPSAGTDVLGECYNDSAFDESLTINASASNVDSITLSVATGERHDGTAGTGARIVSSVDGRLITLSKTSGSTLVFEWLEFDLNSKSGAITTAGSTFGRVPEVRRMVIHDFLGISGAPTTLINGSARDLLFHNNIIYNYSRDSTITMVVIDLDSDTADGGFLNNTVVGVANPNATGSITGLNVGSDSANGRIRNNIVMDATVGGSGTPLAYSFAGSTNITSSNNMSSDATADDGGGSGHLLSQVTADQFESIIGGSEDLHLKSGADAIDVGVDLGVVPAGVEIDIDGWNRDSDSPSRDPWDMGAHEFEPPPVGGNEGAAMYHHLQNIGAY